jgi:hypothetical protein
MILPSSHQHADKATASKHNDHPILTETSRIYKLCLNWLNLARIGANRLRH